MSRPLIAALIAAIACLLIFVLALPQYDGLSAARGALAERRGLLADRQAQSENFDALLRQYNEQRVGVANLNQLVPARQQPDQIIASLQAAGEANGLQLTELTIAADTNNAQTNERFNASIVRLNMAGDYRALVGFLKQVEQSLRIYDVKEISISRSSTGGFYLELLISAYNLK